MHLTARDYDAHYVTMGLQPGSSLKALQTSFRMLAKKLHPDRNPGQSGEEFKAMSDAYQALKSFWEQHEKAPPSMLTQLQLDEEEERQRQAREETARRQREKERQRERERAEAHRRAALPLSVPPIEKGLAHHLFDFVDSFPNGFLIAVSIYVMAAAIPSFAIAATIYSWIDAMDLSYSDRAFYESVYHFCLLVVVLIIIYCVSCPVAYYRLYKLNLDRVERHSKKQLETIPALVPEGLSRVRFPGLTIASEAPVADAGDFSSLIKTSIRFSNPLPIFAGAGFGFDLFVKFKPDVGGYSTRYVAWFKTSAAWQWWIPAFLCVERTLEVLKQTLD